MKLGSQTGSVINHLYSRAVVGQPTPEVGMGATILLWTDRHAATITGVILKGGTTYVTTRDDHSKVVKGSTHDGSAEYEYSPNPKGRLHHFKQGPDGKWHEIYWNEATKRWNKAARGGGHGLRIGSREEYRDPSF